ncbi:hypothetical protein [Parabacteroides pacaensis]|uniref:hypothetical protein n=1 Tax=Parabacteroides pacaensis TaxID=2086575 RepID=UPI000D11457F|nr:hypothetical protein [Parabacteroides pacaensis]
MKVNEIFTVEREVCASTGTDYYVCRIEGGLALLDISISYPVGSPFIGGKAKKVFTFQCIQAGKAAIQFAFVKASIAPHTYMYEQVLPIEIEADDDKMVVGGWSHPQPLTPEDEEVFKKATDGWAGAGFKPLLVATQVVAGLNYRFLCQITTVTQDPQTYLGMVYIFQPFPNDEKVPYITKITALGEDM